ncbi:MAG: ATP-binding protein [Desulfobacteraceae bacterium]|nr:ATP-binding protein [Desulfobacteraceae bacterium]
MALDNIQLSIPSHPKYLQLVRAVMEKVTHTSGFTEDDSDHIILAVDEACSNIIKHSYMNNPEGKIDISIEIHEKELKINVTDYGNQCDIKQMQSRDLKDIKPGGLGIYIMNQVMDSVKYDCSSAMQNHVSMIKRMKKVKNNLNTLSKI